MTQTTGYWGSRYQIKRHRELISKQMFRKWGACIKGIHCRHLEDRTIYGLRKQVKMLVWFLKMEAPGRKNGRKLVGLPGAG